MINPFAVALLTRHACVLLCFAQQDARIFILGCCLPIPGKLLQGRFGVSPELVEQFLLGRLCLLNTAVSAVFYDIPMQARSSR